MSAVKFWAGFCFLGLALGIPGLLALVWAVVTFLRGDFLTCIAALGFSIIAAGILVPIVIARTGHVRVRGEYHSDGTLLRPDRTTDVLSQAAAVGQVVAMGLYAIFSPTDKVHIPVPHGMEPYFLIVCASGALWGLRTLWAVLSHGGISYLRLTSEGFEIWERLRFTQGTWDAVRGVAAAAPGRPWPMRRIMYLLGAGQVTPSLVVDSYTPDGYALREWVRFYWSHPEKRAELTDGRALDRLHSMAQNPGG